MKLNTYCKKVLATGLLTLASSYSLAADKVTFQLDWLPGADKASIFVGKNKGFFAEEGLDVTIASGRGSNDAITKLATGNSDIGLADITALMIAKARRDVPVTAVMSIFSDAPHAIFTLSDSGINGISDLKGKKVVTSPFTSSNAFFPLVLNLNNVQEDQVEVVKADPAAMAPMLINNRADALISWVTDTKKLESLAAKAGKEMKVIPWNKAGMSIYSASLIANDDFLKEKPEVAARFVKAFKKSVEYTWEHPEESAELLRQSVPEVSTQVAVDTINAIRSLVYNEATDSHGLGALNSERLVKTWEFTAQAQKIELSELDPEILINREFISGE